MNISTIYLLLFCLQIHFPQFQIDDSAFNLHLPYPLTPVNAQMHCTATPFLESMDWTTLNSAWWLDNPHRTRHPEKFKSALPHWKRFSEKLSSLKWVYSHLSTKSFHPTLLKTEVIHCPSQPQFLSSLPYICIIIFLNGLLYPEYGHSMFITKIGMFLLGYMESLPRRQWYSHSLLWEPQISPIIKLLLNLTVFEL
jgi:hypothetical protein